MNTYEALCWVSASKMPLAQLEKKCKEMSEQSRGQPLHITDPALFTEYIVYFKVFCKRRDIKVQGIPFPSECLEHEVLPLRGGPHDHVFQSSKGLIAFNMIHAKLTPEFAAKIMGRRSREGNIDTVENLTLRDGTGVVERKLTMTDHTNGGASKKK